MSEERAVNEIRTGNKQDQVHAIIERTAGAGDSLDHDSACPREAGICRRELVQATATRPARVAI